MFVDRKFDSVFFITVFINITDFEDKIRVLFVLHMEIDEQLFIRIQREDVVSGVFRWYLLVVRVAGL